MNASAALNAKGVAAKVLSSPRDGGKDGLDRMNNKCRKSLVPPPDMDH
jgi:hypothetical protein